MTHEGRTYACTAEEHAYLAALKAFHLAPRQGAQERDAAIAMDRARWALVVSYESLRR